MDLHIQALRSVQQLQQYAAVRTMLPDELFAQPEARCGGNFIPQRGIGRFPQTAETGSRQGARSGSLHGGSDPFFGKVIVYGRVFPP